MIFRILCITMCLCLTASTGAQEPGGDARKQQELKWARRVAEDFLQGVDAERARQEAEKRAKEAKEKRSDGREPGDASPARPKRRGPHESSVLMGLRQSPKERQEARGIFYRGEHSFQRSVGGNDCRPAALH